MKKVNKEIPSLINGVSQQHPQLRLSSQTDIMENMTPSLVHGVRTRAPIRYRAPLVQNFSPNTKIKTHLVARGDNTPQLLLFYNNTCRRFAENGDLLPTTITTSSYITTPNPDTDLEIRTAADTTIVVNKTKKVAMCENIFRTRAPQALVFVKIASYLTTYTLEIGGTIAIHQTQAGVGTESAPPEAISTEGIAQSLVVGGTGGSVGDPFEGWPTGCSVATLNSVILITADTEELLNTIKAYDSRGNTQMIVINKFTENYSDLPRYAPHGFTTKIVEGSVRDADEGYWVEFVANNQEAFISEGYWVECVAPNTPQVFDGSTLPHAIITKQDGSAEFNSISWGVRSTGDEKSNPRPSFFDRTINDVFFYKNRLGILSDDNVILSRAGDLFSFWNESARTVIDSDPIDYSASQENVHKLKYALSFQNDTIIFSEKTQVVLEGTTPSDAVIKPLTTHTLRRNSRPVEGNKTLYFITDSVDETRVFEMYVDVENDVKEAVDITAHVPAYVDATVNSFISNSSKNLLFLLAHDGKSIYVYKYFWAGKEKLQSAWFKWKLPVGCVCKAMETDKDTLYLFNVYGTTLVLETVSLDYNALVDSEARPVCLDRQVDLIDCLTAYDAATSRTHITFPPTFTNYNDIVCVDTRTGLCVEPLFYSTGRKITLEGYYNNGDIVFGFPYKATLQFSDQRIKTGEEGYALTTGRLQYRAWKITFGPSAFLTISVHRHLKKDNVETVGDVVSSALVGVFPCGIGKAELTEGTHRIGVYSNADDVKIRVTSEYHLPISILSAAWEGVYTSRAGTTTS